MPKQFNPIVMVVEDDFVDSEVIRRGIKNRKLDYEIFSENNARSALELLRSDEFSDESIEKLVIFLDINMPGMNGHQFLEELRNDPKLKRTIVFVLSSSDHVRDKAQAYERSIAGYFVKSNIDGLLDTLAVYVNNVEFPPCPSL
jgi:CheY-like chemotaxis protein